MSTVLKLSPLSLVGNPGVSLRHGLVDMATIDASEWSEGIAQVLYLIFLNKICRPVRVLPLSLLIFLLDLLEDSHPNRLLLALLSPQRFESATLSAVTVHCFIV